MAQQTLGTATLEMAANIGRLQADLGRAQAQIQRFANRASQTLKIAAGAFAFDQVTDVVASAVRVADEWTRVRSSLVLVAGGMQQALALQQQLFEVAQRTRQSYTALAGTFAALARAAAETGVSQERLLRVVETISQATQIGGGSNEGIQAALMQFGQGLAANRLGGEELNSVLEQTPRLAQAIAQGLDVPIGQLRKMAEAGELTADQVIRALEKASGQVANDFGKMEVTVSAAFQRMSNSVGALIDRINQLTGATRGIAAVLDFVSGRLDRVTKNLSPDTASVEAALDRIAKKRAELQASIAQRGPGNLFGIADLDQRSQLAALDAREQQLRRMQAATRLDDNAAAVEGIAKSWEDAAAATERAKKPAAEALDLYRQLDGVGKDFQKNLGVLFKEFEAGRLPLAEYRSRVQSLIESDTDVGKEAKKKREKKPGSTGGGGKTAAEQQLENEAAAARKLTAEAERLAADRLRVLDQYRDLDLVGEAEYFAARSAIQDEGLRSALTEAEREIAARNAILKRTKPGTADYERALADVRDAERERAEVQARHAQAVQEDWFAQARAAREYQDAVRGITAELAELEGQAADAAAIRFDEQHGDTVRQALERGDTGTIERVGRLRRNRISGADFGAASEQASTLQQRLQIDEERIQNNLRMGAIGDIEAMRRTSALRQEALEQLTAIEQRMRDVAAASSDPRIHLNLAQFQSDLERLRAEADVFGLKMREIGEGAVGTFFSDIVSGTKSVTRAFRDMVGSILSEMSRIVSRDIARAVMGSVSGAVTGGTGGGSGWAGLLGSIGQAAIGYFQGGGAGAGVSTAGSYAYASPEALAIPARDRRALGGVVIAGREYVVGDRADRAPEWFVPQVSGRIVTADPGRPDAIMLPGPQAAARTLAAPEAAHTPAERMRRALGGPVVAGSPYIVGDRADRGREWFAPAAEQVRPAVQRAETMSQLVAMRDELQSIRVTASETIAPRMQRALGGAVVAGRPYVVGDRADRRAEWFEPAADRVRAANRRALGGMVVGGQAYSVNEQVRHDARPEVFIPAMNGSVANKAPGGRPGLVVNMTVNARDARSFLESESQVQASVARAANRGRRNL